MIATLRGRADISRDEELLVPRHGDGSKIKTDFSQNLRFFKTERILESVAFVSNLQLFVWISLKVSIKIHLATTML